MAAEIDKVSIGMKREWAEAHQKWAHPEEEACGLCYQWVLFEAKARIETLEEANTRLRKDCLNVLMSKLPMTHAVITMLDESEIDVHGVSRELIVNWIVTAQTRIEALEKKDGQG